MTQRLHLSQQATEKLERFLIAFIVGVFSAIGIIAAISGATNTPLESSDPLQLFVEFTLLAGVISRRVLKKA